MPYELCKCNIGIVWLVGGLGYSLKLLVRPHVLILTVGDTPSTDDQVFVCQLGSVIEVRCGARITISTLLQPGAADKRDYEGARAAASSCLSRVARVGGVVGMLGV